MNNLQANSRTYWKIITGAISIALLSILLPGGLRAQTQYVVGTGSQITVAGTSSLHDWTMTATNFQLEGLFSLKSGQLLKISSLTFALPVSSLKSKESMMDKKAYKALNSEKFNRITFKLADATVLAQQKMIKVSGTLTIAGVSKEVTMQSSYVLNADESINCKLTKALTMSEFNVKPPTFMMGAIKTGDAITIDIQLKLRKENLTAQSN